MSGRRPLVAWSPDDVPDRILAIYSHKWCHALAVAMHRRTGWTILTLHDGSARGGSRYLDQAGAILHGGVVDPDGGFWDIRGRHGPDDLGAVAATYMADPTGARWILDLEPSEEDLREMLVDDGGLDDAIELAEMMLDSLQSHLAGRNAALTHR